MNLSSFSRADRSRCPDTEPRPRVDHGGRARRFWVPGGSRHRPERVRTIATPRRRGAGDALCWCRPSTNLAHMVAPRRLVGRGALTSVTARSRGSGQRLGRTPVFTPHPDGWIRAGACRGRAASGTLHEGVRRLHESAGRRPLGVALILTARVRAGSLDVAPVTLYAPMGATASAPGRTRTCDLEIRRLLLYPAELQGPGTIVHRRPCIIRDSTTSLRVTTHRPAKSAPLGPCPSVR